MRTTASLDANMSTGHSRRAPPPHLNGRKMTVGKSKQQQQQQQKPHGIEESDSELSDAPDEDTEDDGTVAEGSEEEDEDRDGGSHNLDVSESDDDMAERLRAAGDGESLLGSAISDREGGETDEEEARFIIEDTTRRRAKTNALRTSRRTPIGIKTEGKQDAYPDNASGSLSPETLHQLGLDELFEGPDALHSSSEPSFTDSFGSDSEDGTEDGLTLDARPDDDQLTTDDEDSETDISDLENDLLSANFLGEALAAGAGTQLTPGAAEQNAQADIPLLVIEDLDGRLIYARAGDGEAVFGSDGEFEFVDESDEESEADDDVHFHMDGFGGSRWDGWRTEAGDETDEGETTDELPNEDMPFPRLLVGSVAPHGGRSARRARAMAARSRRISPSGHGRSRESSTVKETQNAVQQLASNTDAAAALQDVDFSISTEDLARDPQATLEAAAKSLGLSVNEVAQLVIGSAQMPGSSIESPVLNDCRALPPVTPDNRRNLRAPAMGSFMPTSSKSVHRAVIDGSNQAPSPFTSRHGTQRKGLASRKHQTSHSTPSAKRIRRGSLVNPASSSQAAEISENDNDASSTHEPTEIDEMDLDDVMDASLLWRNSYSSSPPHGNAEEKAGKKSPAMRATVRRSSGGTPTSPKGTGLNLNAVARWHRIPMGAFRDGQVSASAAKQQPLGAFLLTRTRGGNQAGKGLSSRNDDQSPFRGRTQGESIHLGQAPKTITQDSFMVSPVLWPSRHTGQGGSSSSGGIGQNGMRSGPAQMSSYAQPDGRKLMTRREKRERKARKATLKAALRAGNNLETESTSISQNGSPMPMAVTEADLLRSPSATLPHLSITDASPHVSPMLPSKSLPPSSLSRVQDVTMSAEQNGHRPNKGKMGHGAATAPMDIPTAWQSSPFAGAAHHGSSGTGQNGSFPSTSPSSASSQHQPPSSVFGMPLHSPLFGSIFNPPNLGFRDDLDERDEEGVLTI